jgi:murein DD-endopeptidase MepM/ murein hydrolase activator NlpD
MSNQGESMQLSDDNAKMLKALYSARLADTKQTNRMLTLGLIIIILVWVRWIHPAINTAKETAKNVSPKIESVANAIAPDLDSTPQAGETIGGYRITSAYGLRNAPCDGCSSDHKGVDVGMPHGSQQFVADHPSQTVDVECFRYSYRGKTENGAKFTTSYGITIRAIHLSKCQGGKVKGGTVFGLTGTSGTGAHAHIETYRDGEIFAPPRIIVHWTVTGSKPSPIVSRGQNAED